MVMVVVCLLYHFVSHVVAMGGPRGAREILLIGKALAPQYWPCTGSPNLTLIALTRPALALNGLSPQDYGPCMGLLASSMVLLTESLW